MGRAASAKAIITASLFITHLLGDGEEKRKPHKGNPRWGFGWTLWKRLHELLQKERVNLPGADYRYE
jgi:hypothetical protein